MLDLLHPSAIVVGSNATTDREVIAELAARLEALGVVKPSYAAAVSLREETMPTGLPLADDFAVAVPHTDPEHVLQPGLALATLARPVEFGSMDDPEERLQVRLVFALALVDKRQQIDTLRRVAGLLQNPALLRRIADAPSADDILAALRGDIVKA